MPLLATRYHVVAPDFPAFGQSDTPSPATYTYTFDHLAKTMDALLEQLKIRSLHALPVRLRIAGRLIASCWLTPNDYRR